MLTIDPEILTWAEPRSCLTGLWIDGGNLSIGGIRVLTREFETTKDHCRQAVDLMLSRGIVPNPRNYELFYAYSEGGDGKLTATLDKVLLENPTPSDLEIRKLHENHVRRFEGEYKLDALGKDLTRETREFVTAVQEAVDTASEFGASLEGAESSLALCNDPEKLKVVLKALTEQTKHTRETNLAVEERLVESRNQIAQLQQDLETVQSEALTDPLTGIANRKQLDEMLDQQVTSARDESEPLCLFMVDIDHFKQFNDTYGHQMGDSVLRLVANEMSRHVRDEDLVARYGGEEFAVILPRTQLNRAVETAEAIRASIMSRELVNKTSGKSLGKVTISIGVGEFEASDTADSLIGKADTNLYAAKHAGRNRIQS